MKRQGNYNRRGPVATIDPERLARLARRRLSDAEIAERLGVTAQAVNKARHRLGIARLPRGRRPRRSHLMREAAE